MKTISVTFVTMSLISMGVNAAELKDPRTRDEDLSATQLTVEYELRGDGLYEYTYSITSPESNFGTIQELVIDLSCSKSVDGPTPPESGGEGFLGNLSKDGNHVPVTIEADYGQSGYFTIDLRNKARWLLSMKPGNSATGLRLISPAQPGLREFEILPFMDNDPSWDYPEEPDPTIPWISDFTISGMIPGPGCPGVSPPVDEPVFEGSGNQHVEPESINELLVYKEPLKDKIAVDLDTDSIMMTIVYSQDIDPKTFHVQPGYLRKYFDPVPGTSQSVSIPLKAAKDLVHFEVRSNAEHGPRKNDPDNPSYKDRDTFEFRRK